MSDELHLPSTSTRSRIISAAAKLIAEGGAEAATTRAVSTEANVQAPTIYRLFGDKDGLLEAVAEQTMADYVADKGRRVSDDDPIEGLRHGWDLHVAFGLAHPSIFGLMSATPLGRSSRANRAGLDILRDRVLRVALTGRLRCTTERAVDLIHAMGTGTILVLLEKPHDQLDGLSEHARDAVLAAIIVDHPPPRDPGSAGPASALRAILPDIDVLTLGERQLLDELLERIARTRSGG